MALTATATPKVQDDIKKLLRNPVVTQASINRSNITLAATEVEVAQSSDYTITLLQSMLVILAIQNLQLFTQTLLQTLVQL